MTPDVSVLIAASRSDHPHHKPAIAVLDEALAACAHGASLKLMPMVVASFLRLVTHPKIFVQPTPMDEALGFVDALLAVPGVEMPALGAEWPILRQLCREKVIARDTIIRLEKGLPVYRSSVEHLAARLAIPVDELRALLGHPLEVLR